MGWASYRVSNYDGKIKDLGNGRQWKYNSAKDVWKLAASSDVVSGVQGVAGTNGSNGSTGARGATGATGPAGPAASSGTLGQVKIDTDTGYYYIGSGTGWENVGMNIAITPTSTSSRILICWNTAVMMNPTSNLGRVQTRIVKGSSTEIFRLPDNYCDENDAWRTYVQSGTYIYSPNTTSATTFRIQMSTAESGTDSSVRINHYDGKQYIQVTEIL